MQQQHPQAVGTIATIQGIRSGESAAIGLVATMSGTTSRNPPPTREEDKFMREQREARYRHALKAANLTPAILRRTFDTFEVIPENRDGYIAARSFEIGRKGLVLLGPCGTGKTHLASAL